MKAWLGCNTHHKYTLTILRVSTKEEGLCLYLTLSAKRKRLQKVRPTTVLFDHSLCSWQILTQQQGLVHTRAYSLLLNEQFEQEQFHSVPRYF